MTKVVTATACMQLVGKNVIKLDDDIRHLIPELANAQILQGFDGDDKAILVENIDPITMR